MKRTQDTLAGSTSFQTHLRSPISNFLELSLEVLLLSFPPPLPSPPPLPPAGTVSYLPVFKATTALPSLWSLLTNLPGLRGSHYLSVLENSMAQFLTKSMGIKWGLQCSHCTTLTVRLEHPRTTLPLYQAALASRQLPDPGFGNCLGLLSCFPML